jgi:hypothetical protein
MSTEMDVCSTFSRGYSNSRNAQPIVIAQSVQYVIDSFGDLGNSCSETWHVFWTGTIEKQKKTKFLMAVVGGTHKKPRLHVSTTVAKGTNCNQ